MLKVRATTRLRRAAVVLASSALIVASGGAAQATDDPSVLQSAQSILGALQPGEPLRVVVTSRTSGAPSVVGTTVSTPAQALDLIAAGLANPSTIGVEMAHTVRMAVLANDPYRSRQWALTRLHAESVWTKSTGSGVVVAVVDTGVTGSHPDLSGHVLAGKDFVVPGTSAADENGHGTHVAGIITAVANNNRGVAGLARSSRVLPVRVLNGNGEGTSDAVANGIIWAAQHGANVINLSLGSYSSDSAEEAAVAYAVSRNVVVVAAAGNDGCSTGLLGGGLLGGGGLFGPTVTYPAAYPSVLGVGAIESNGAVAPYSTCGTFVDVAAPGSKIISTMISNPNSDLGCSSSGYCYLSGTSMATPYAAATAAIEIAKLGGGWRQATVRSRMQSTADDIGASGRDDSSGYGVINPLRMLALR